MPFVYYGGKKGSAHRYPPPAYPTIIEPFAGSAGYALAWAKPTTRVILIEKDPVIIDVWRRLQAPGARQWLLALKMPDHGQPCEPIMALTTGHPIHSLTTRIKRDWSRVRNRIITAIPIIQNWEVIEGDYTAAPPVPGTWFVDPPYAPNGGRNPGSSYRRGFSSAEIDYEALGAWCKQRPGQVIVCEQEGAEWLPFRRLFIQHTQTTGAGGIPNPPRVEVVWTRTPGTSMPGTARTISAHQARKTRRAARTRGAPQ